MTAGDRLVVELDGYWESRDFVVTNLDDRDRQGIRANMVQTVSERFAAGVFVEFIEESFADPTAGDFDEQIYGFRLFFRPAERYQFELVASNVQRDTDTPNLSFEENLVRLNVTYDVFGDRGVGVGRRVDR